MPRRFHPRFVPAGEVLARRSVHEVVRDVPEALAALRRLGVDVAGEGGRPLGDLEDAPGALRAVRAAASWREPTS